MKLILLESVDGLGRPGDQVAVKAGFARNYLLPYRKAILLSPDALRMLDRLKKKAEEEERAMISSMQELAGKLAGVAVEVRARATDEGHLFGSVTEKDIHIALTEQGWDVPLRAVRLAAHIKEAGTSEVELHLHGEILASIQLTVVPVDGEGDTIIPGETVSAEAGPGSSEAGEPSEPAEAAESVERQSADV